MGITDMMLPWKKKKLIRYLNEAWGKPPEGEYDPGDMEDIRSFFDACRKDGRDPFYVDDTTWNDLDLESLYRRINACQCTAGEQYLYYLLRTPMDRASYARQLGLIRFMQETPDARLKAQLLLRGIGSRRRVDLTGVFHPAGTSPVWPVLYCFLALLLLASALAALFIDRGLLIPALIMIIVNPLFHELRRTRCEHEITRVNYCVSLALALKKMKKWNIPQLDAGLSYAYVHLDRMKAILRSGPVMSRLNSDMFQQLTMSFFLLDLISFEILKYRLAKYHDHFLAVHEAIGRIDAAIAIASYRAGLDTWCEPEIDVEADHPYIRAEGAVHPLVKDPVPNDVVMGKSILVTGSNASGKSTYLRSAALCALMAETLCTCTCRAYRGSFFRIYTSMALSDDLAAGESCYMAEIRSVKRILDEQKRQGWVLCALDEVLRGTNTVERIAASAEILSALDRPGTLCLAATHDAELCALTGERYRQAHFEETVTDSGIAFDYRLKDGPAETRNAIRLLKLMGFDDEIVEAADRRADRYGKTGKWTD